MEVHIKFEYWQKRAWPLKDRWRSAGEQVTKHIDNVYVYVKNGNSTGTGTINAGPVTNNANLSKGLIFTWNTINYVKISGEMKATVFSRSYDISGVLWEQNF